jgi:hypothetical protein
LRALKGCQPPSAEHVNLKNAQRKNRGDARTGYRKELGGIIYIANADGLWILKQNQVPDKSLDADYRNYVLYGSR